MLQYFSHPKETNVFQRLIKHAMKVCRHGTIATRHLSQKSMKSGQLYALAAWPHVRSRYPLNRIVGGPRRGSVGGQESNSALKMCTVPQSRGEFIFLWLADRSKTTVPRSEADSHPAKQQKVYHSVKNSPPMDLSLGQTKPVHTLPSKGEPSQFEVHKWCFTVPNGWQEKHPQSRGKDTQFLSCAHKVCAVSATHTIRPGVMVLAPEQYICARTLKLADWMTGSSHETTDIFTCHYLRLKVHTQTVHELCLYKTCKLTLTFYSYT